MVTCILCKREINGYGNNAQPLAEGMCCDGCNNKVVANRMANYKMETVDDSLVSKEFWKIRKSVYISEPKVSVIENKSIRDYAHHVCVPINTYVVRRYIRSHGYPNGHTTK